MQKIMALFLALMLCSGLRTLTEVDPGALVEDAEIEQKIAEMTLEEKVGQLFMPRYPGPDSPSQTQLFQPAGYTLYAADFAGKSREQVQDELATCQSAAKIPLFMAVDEEGGPVVRVSSNPALADTPFDSPQNVYHDGGIEAIRRDTENKAQLLLGLGLNLNLAPVCDFSTNANDYIYSRTLGVPAEETAAVIAEIVSVMEAQGISCTLKHFPGYGSNLNTHTGISIDERPYGQFQQEDFLPFKAGIDAGAPSVLVSHNIILAMDGEKPASLSTQVHEILRDGLGFQGVVMTDDLSMDAIKLYTGGQSPAVAALLAGNDLLLTSDWEADFHALLAAVQEGSVPVGRVEESVRRILEWKYRKGLF